MNKYRDFALLVTYFVEFLLILLLSRYHYFKLTNSKYLICLHELILLLVNE
jgi:hypothetical protein